MIEDIKNMIRTYHTELKKETVYEEGCEAATGLSAIGRYLTSMKAAVSGKVSDFNIQGNPRYELNLSDIFIYIAAGAGLPSFSLSEKDVIYDSDKKISPLTRDGKMMCRAERMFIVFSSIGLIDESKYKKVKYSQLFVNPCMLYGPSPRSAAIRLIYNEIISESKPDKARKIVCNVANRRAVIINAVKAIRFHNSPVVILAMVNMTLYHIEEDLVASAEISCLEVNEIKQCHI